MKPSDFRIGWRLLLRHPLQSAVEILGLATGFAVCFLLLGFVAYSFSYDKDVPQSERVFVIKHRLNFIPQPQWMEYTPFALREVALRSGLPLEASAWWPRKATLQLQGRTQELDVTAVDPAFQSISGLSALEGDLHAALTRPDGLAVTRQTALRLFGTTQALGRTVEINRQALQVRAVLADRPPNSTLQFNALVGLGTALWPEKEQQEAMSSWMSIGGRIYVKTGPGVTPQALQRVLQDTIDRAPWDNLATPEMKAALAKRKMVDVALGPLADAYFDRSVANTMGSGPRGDMRVVLALGATGLLILVLAVVNYVNLATVRTLRRQREIAMRRVLGASTRQLLVQFMAESMLLSTAAAALGVLVAWLLLPLASDLLERPLDGVFTSAAVGACLLSGALVGAAAGVYPGWLARGVDMNATLAHRSGETAGGVWLRRVLTTVQFSVAMCMGSLALAILWQTQFAAEASPGFDPAPLLVVEMKDNLRDSAAARSLRDAIAQLPGVAGVTDSGDVPGRDDMTGTHGSTTVNRVDGNSASVSVHWVGPDFFNVYGLKSLAGRMFDPRIEGAAGDGEQNIVINQAAVQALGWPSAQQAVGQRIGGTQWRIVGVAPDPRWETLRDPVRPSLYLIAQNSKLLTVRMRDVPDARNREALERDIAAAWSRYFPASEPVIRAAGSYYAQAYAEDVRIARLLACATAVVFALAAFGIYVLAAHSVQRRAREIVLRKLHGAGRDAIAVLVSREFLLLTAAAAAAGLPLAWLAIERYLAGFAERSPLGGWAPAAALAFALLIVAMATIRHTVAAMRIAPAQALRD
ncbi:FtsX-like permease family protein [Rugamonas sp. FT107W]|uniref:FtsX-like permease family protein n=1 Tax=Duganella vulcania TaxID=2692166 RepID=A0A845HAH7_9BURK|nr:ABC transporter permease [Duganella vulcania]MYN15638.1 FtsX-like permease family protein [Duganella vulcania]